MDALTLRPEKVQKTLWYVSWLIILAAGVVVLLLLSLANAVLFGLLLIPWLFVMLLVLAWIGAFYRSIGYSIDSDAIRGQAGVFWKRQVTVPFAKITNIDMTQGPLQRAFNLGTIHIQTAGAGGNQGGHAELRLVGIRQLESTRETIRARIRTCDRTKAEPPAMEPPGETPVQPILQQILQELQAIRELLQKR